MIVKGSKKDCKLSPWTCGKLTEFSCAVRTHQKTELSRSGSCALPTTIISEAFRSDSCHGVEHSHLTGFARSATQGRAELHRRTQNSTAACHPSTSNMEMCREWVLAREKSSCVAEAACVARIFSHRAFFWCIMLRGSLMTLIWDDKVSCSPSSSLKKASAPWIKASGTVTFFLGAPVSNCCENFYSHSCAIYSQKSTHETVCSRRHVPLIRRLWNVINLYQFACWVFEQ